LCCGLVFGKWRWWCCSGVGVVGDGDGDGSVLEGVSGAVLVLDLVCWCAGDGSGEHGGVGSGAVGVCDGLGFLF
jgi:hypothetical protein